MSETAQMIVLGVFEHFKNQEWALNMLVVLFAVKVCMDLAQLWLNWRRK